MGNAKPDTLCWRCKNAVPTKNGAQGCAWSRNFEPVEGWEAIATEVYVGKKTPAIISYIVQNCPEFKED